MKRTVVAVAILAALLTACIPSSKTDKDLKTTGGASVGASSSPPSAPAVTPRPMDFQLEVIETEKNCYGSAGCNVTYIIDPTYVGAPLDDSTSYTVIYEVTGGEAPETASFTVQGDQYQKPGEDMISTDSSATVLRATVTRVVED